MEGSFYINNINALHSHDQVKFVISDARDFHWSLDFVKSKKPAQALYCEFFTKH